MNKRVVRRHLRIASVHCVAIMDLLADAQNDFDADFYQSIGLIWDDLEKLKQKIKK